MDTRQIDHMLRAVKEFKGTLPLDRLPPAAPKEPFAYVVNLDEADKPGSHWVCLYSSDRVVEYFDSFGLIPWKTEFFRFAGSRPFVYNAKRVQSFYAKTCGAYCVFYILSRARHESRESILSHFGTDLFANDTLIADFVRRTL